MPLDVTAPVSPAPDDGPMPPPGYTLYRPSGSAPTARPDSGSVDPDDPGSDPGNKDRGT
jgi:hypothetical protein